jgi:threonine 3-dehydrogenase
MLQSNSSRVLVLTRPEAGAVELVSRPLAALGPTDVAVRVTTAGICGTDLHIIGWNAWAAGAYQPPIALGHEFCGTVMAVGSEVHRFAAGDRVVAETHLACGHCRQCRMNRRHICENLKVFSRLGQGGFAEKTVVPSALLRHVPDGVSDGLATLMEPLGVAVRAAMIADLRGASVYIAGCGPIGLLTVAAAKAYGARKIIVSDLSPARTALAIRMGAEAVIKADGEDFLERIKVETGGTGVDVAIDTTGVARAIETALAATTTGGRLVLTGIPSGPISLDLGRHVVLREVAINGLYGRLLDETWLQVEALLTRSDVDLAPILTHTFRLEDFERAFEIARNGASGKVRFVMNGEA